MRVEARERTIPIVLLPGTIYAAVDATYLLQQLAHEWQTVAHFFKLASPLASQALAQEAHASLQLLASDLPAVFA